MAVTYLEPFVRVPRLSPVTVACGGRERGIHIPAAMQMQGDPNMHTHQAGLGYQRQGMYKRTRLTTLCMHSCSYSCHLRIVCAGEGHQLHSIFIASCSCRGHEARLLRLVWLEVLAIYHT